MGYGRRGRYGRRGGYSRSDYYPQYVSVAEKAAKARAVAEKLKKQGQSLSPVEGDWRCKTFWGKSWVAALESCADFENRLGRGRSYLRQGSVIDLRIEEGVIRAQVNGTSLYKVEVKIAPLGKSAWAKLRQHCVGKISSLISLLEGKLSNDLLKEVGRVGALIPDPKDFHLKCSCPDGAWLCKHIAAVLYGVGRRLETEPAQLFSLRGVSQSELVAEATLTDLTVPRDSSIADSELGDIFGISLDVSSRESKTGVEEKESKPESPEMTLVAPGELRSLGCNEVMKRRWLEAGIIERRGPNFLLTETAILTLEALRGM